MNFGERSLGEEVVVGLHSTGCAWSVVVQEGPCMQEEAGTDANIIDNVYTAFTDEVHAHSVQLHSVQLHPVQLHSVLYCTYCTARAVDGWHARPGISIYSCIIYSCNHKTDAGKVSSCDHLIIERVHIYSRCLCLPAPIWKLPFTCAQPGSDLSTTGAELCLG